MSDLQRRFRDVTLPLFKRHGIGVIGFWTAEVGKSNRIHYILQWQDMTDREARWKAFASDPDWHTGRDASEAGGPLIRRIVNEFWNPTDYSLLK